MSDSESEVARRYQIAFPMLDFRGTDGLGRTVRTHWLYHLEVVLGSAERSHPSFFPANQGWLARMSRLLHLGPTPLAVRALELVPDPHYEAGSVSDHAFPIRQHFDGNSWNLALAVALAAASSGIELESWLVCSGCMDGNPDEVLDLTETGDVNLKVKLCLGREPDFDVSSRVNAMYQHRATEKSHGPKDRRTVSGGVKLLITPTLTEGWEEPDREELGAEYLIDVTPADLRGPTPADLNEKVSRLAPDGLLLVQVPTVWHALYLLGLATEEQVPKGPSGHVFRVPANGMAGAKGEEEYRRRKVAEALARLDQQLGDIPDFYGRLREVVRQAVQAVDDCKDGNLRRVTSDGLWLERIATHGSKEMEELPVLVPAFQGINGGTFAQQKAQELTTPQLVKAARGFNDPRQGGRGLEEVYPPEDCYRYYQVLEQVGSCLVVPLRQGNRTVGVLCLPRKGPGAFSPLQVEVVHALAGRAAAVVAERLDHDKRAREWREPIFHDLSKLLRNTANRSVADFLERLGDSLARWACKSSGAYRAAVRILQPGGESLRVISLIGKWPDTFRDGPFQRSQNGQVAAYDHALHTGKSVIIPDTRQTALPYKEIEPPAAAHLAILLRHGVRPIGVLSVDFKADKRTNCDERMRDRLEDLSSIYAPHLHTTSKERLYGDLLASLPELQKLAASVEPETIRARLEDWLRCVGGLLGVTCGTLFLRDVAEGEYRTAATLPEPDGDPKASYLPGEGRTGWVAANKLPLLVVDCADLRELAQIKPRLHRSRVPDCWDKQRQKLSYLGVPILVGGDVLGVLRFVCKTPKEADSALVKTHFTKLDLQLAQAAASQLVPWLHRLQERRLGNAMENLMRHLLDVPTREAACQRIHEALVAGIGPCSVVVRVADEWETGPKPPRTVLERLYVGDGEPADCPRIRAEGEGFSGKAWQTKKRQVSQELAKDPLVLAAGQAEAWWRHYHSMVAVPLMARDEVLGTLMVLRKGKGGLLEADIEFIDRVARLPGLVFTRLDEAEVRTDQEAFYLPVHSFHQSLALPSRPEGDVPLLINRLCEALEQRGIAASDSSTTRVFAWCYDDRTRKCEGRSRAAAVSYDRVDAAFAADSLIVASDPGPEGDSRLRFLYDALPDAARACQSWQHAAFLVRRDERYRVVPPTVFLLAVQPPLRLSHRRAQWLRRHLNTILARPHPHPHRD